LTVVAGGISGFLANLDEAREQADQESSRIRSFMKTWESELGLGPKYATEVLKIAQQFFEFPENVRSAAIRLGKILSKYEHQAHGDLRIQSIAAAEGKTQWVLERVEEAASAL
jgi:hypothetical protein